MAMTLYIHTFIREEEDLTSFRGREREWNEKKKFNPIKWIFDVRNKTPQHSPLSSLFIFLSLKSELNKTVFLSLVLPKFWEDFLIAIYTYTTNYICIYTPVCSWFWGFLEGKCEFILLMLKRVKNIEEFITLTSITRI